MSAKEYLLNDHPRTLFPLNTTRVLVEHCFDAFRDYAYTKVVNPAEADAFLPQTRCYASKQGLHLRRTVKLDPVAEVFIYDLVYRNRTSFRPDFRPNRRSFGFRFRDGAPISLTESYFAFREAIIEGKNTYRYAARFDISNYFNSLYHHDLIAWFAEGGRAPAEVEQLGQFLRETNSGRSLDCLPQGIHPCKLLGAEYLKFVDNSVRLRSELILRFMDDFYIFSDDREVIESDFLIVQQILGEKGLSLNAEKTALGDVVEVDVRQEVDAIRAELLRVRRRVIDASVIADEPIDVEQTLDEEQTEYLLNLLQNPEIDESDAELVLTLLRDHGVDVLEQMGTFLERFPSLSRKVYNYAPFIDDYEELGSLLLRFVTAPRHITEDQLFWIAKIAEEHLTNTAAFPDLIIRLFEHPNSTDLTRAKILEIPEPRFGLPELREDHLRTGRSDWTAWSAAVGCRHEVPIRRNHKLSYFRHASPMNSLIADCVKGLPQRPAKH